MSMNRPSRQEILQAVAEYLKEELAPKLSGRQRFQALIAASLLEIVLREITLDPSAFYDPSGLERLLGPEAQGLESREAAEALLCEKIRRGDFDENPARGRLLEYLAAEVRYKIQVDNPKW